MFDGTVEIKSIAREAGSRTKMAVWSADPEVDPRGACIGPRGGRVASIVDELGGEKIDIIKYSEDPGEYIAEALSPAEVISVELLPGPKSCGFIVPTASSPWPSARRGRTPARGQDTGYKIDIKPAREA